MAESKTEKTSDWTPAKQKAKKPAKAKPPANACWNYAECKGLAPLKPQSLTKYRRDCDVCARCQNFATCGNEALVKNKNTGERWADCEDCYQQK